MRTLLWALLVAVALVTMAVVAAPVWLVRPFAAQTLDGLSWSWTLRRAAPVATAAGLGLSLILAALLWRAPVRRRRLAGRAMLALLVLAVTGAAWFARQNHFEWMFRPFPDPRFVSVTVAKDLQAMEPVIAVADRGEALAFPITRIGYHHLVNTTLGGVPIVATY